MFFNRPPKFTIKEALDQKSVTELVRASYLFSQGNPELQLLSFKWIALTQWRDFLKNSSVSDINDFQESINKWRMANQIHNYAKGLGDHGKHAEVVGVNAKESTTPYIEGFFQACQFYREKRVSEKERRGAASEALRLIVEKSLDTELDFLKQGGRPVEENSKRDKWTVFLIDLAILEGSDGFFRWKDVPLEYKTLWKSVVAELKVMAKEDKEIERKVRALVHDYIWTHQETLTEAQRVKIEEVLLG